MALDEVLAREVGRRPPTLRIWEWSAPAVVIGSFQSLRDEVDPAEASRLGLTVVRRISGGAMFVEPGNTITYSLYAPGSLVAGMSFAESYRYLDDWVLGALTGDLGSAAWYQPLNDIASVRGKIGGAAQKRFAGGTVLHHVTMAYDIDADAMTRVLRIGREKLSDKGIPRTVKRVDPLRRQTRLPRAEIVDTLADRFRRRYGLTPDAMTGGELRGPRAGPNEVRLQRVDGAGAMTTRTMESKPCPRPGRPVRGLALLVAATGLMLAAGTVVTGSGPLAGTITASGGHRTTVPRFGFPLQDVTQPHADIGWFIGALAVALAIGLRFTGALARAVRASAIVLAGLVVQGMIGYAQNFSHLPAGLAWLHVTTSVVLWIFVLRLLLSTRVHGPRPEKSAVAETTAVRPGRDRRRLAQAPRTGM